MSQIWWWGGLLLFVLVGLAWLAVRRWRRPLDPPQEYDDHRPSPDRLQGPDRGDQG